MNGSPSTIRRHVHGALASGDLRLEELDELVLQMSAYGGLLVGERLSEAVQEARDRSV